LLGVLRGLAGMVVLSGYPSEIYDELLPDWTRVDKTGAFADGAQIRTECLWLSPATAAALHPKLNLGEGDAGGSSTPSSKS
jgi:DNA adenine methylase